MWHTCRLSQKNGGSVLKALKETVGEGRVESAGGCVLWLRGLHCGSGFRPLLLNVKVISRPPAFMALVERSRAKLGWVMAGTASALPSSCSLGRTEPPETKRGSHATHLTLPGSPNGKWLRRPQQCHGPSAAGASCLWRFVSMIFMFVWVGYETHKSASCPCDSKAVDHANHVEDKNRIKQNHKKRRRVYPSHFLPIIILHPSKMLFV